MQHTLKGLFVLGMLVLPITAHAQEQAQTAAPAAVSAPEAQQEEAPAAEHKKPAAQRQSSAARSQESRQAQPSPVYPPAMSGQDAAAIGSEIHRIQMYMQQIDGKLDMIMKAQEQQQKMLYQVLQQQQPSGGVRLPPDDPHSRRSMKSGQ
jgi:hypothetical protein